MAVEAEIKLDKKVPVVSIAPWKTGSPRILSVGDIAIQANGTITLTREEIIAQAQSGNKLLNGTDGKGSHATWYVEDEYVRKELDYDSDDSKQNVLNLDTVKKIFDLKTMKSFEENIEKKIQTRAEKVFMIDAIKQLKINDYEKIVFVEQYTGNKIK